MGPIADRVGVTRTGSAAERDASVVIATRTLAWVIALGVALMAAGFLLFAWWGGLEAVQTASDPAEFTAAALAGGDDVRWASWADIVLFVPGYVLVLVGVLATFRRHTITPTAARRASILGTWAVVAGGVADEVENTVVQLGLRAIDLSASSVAEAGGPSEGLVSVLNAATAAKFLFGAVALLAVTGLFARAMYRRLVARSGEAP